MEPIPEKKGDSSNFKVVGLNVGIFALYCIIGALTAGSIFSALPVFIIHIILCFVLAIALRKGIWALSGLLILVIGFSTCVVGVMSS
ncbi:hypothetical protein A0256_12295 [Mucilaginibacter sp. PAMC 26640]|nr:hypothetical protein A0256_12295 [Mucilaginibacter sp. PAMC 26640]